MFGGGDRPPFDKFSIDQNKKYGEGGYGATFAAADKATGEKLAVKIIDTRRMKLAAIEKECQILEALSHPNVISVKGHGKGGDDKTQHLYFIFMELAGGGELFDQVIDRGANAMPEATARGFFRQMLDGVTYCHLAGVAHRDLKLENVLLNAAGVIKLIDFGLSHVYPRLADGTVDRSKPLRDVCGSKSYAAPEVLASRGYDGFAADVWSLGVCLFAMLSGFFPLDEASVNDWRFPKLCDAQANRRSTTEAVYSWYKRSARHLTPEVVHLLDHLLMIDPSKRLTMAQLREHAWVLEKPFAAPDQGVFNPTQVVGDEGPTYRGIGSGTYAEVGNASEMLEEDEMPVYRSLGEPEESLMPAQPTPTLARQKGKFNLLDAEMPV